MSCLDIMNVHPGRTRECLDSVRTCIRTRQRQYVLNSRTD